MQPYPCICKEAISGFEPMTNKSPRHNFTAILNNRMLNFDVESFLCQPSIICLVILYEYYGFSVFVFDKQKL